MLTTMWFAVLVYRELLAYDWLYSVGGFPRAQRRVPPLPAASSERSDRDVPSLASAIEIAIIFYWKPVKCLQRSVCTVRILRREGVPARLVVGYRPMPFVAHAWVEVHGRILTDTVEYQKQLRVLYTA
jgi:hypothetical protein